MMARYRLRTASGQQYTWEGNLDEIRWRITEHGHGGPPGVPRWNSREPCARRSVRAVGGAVNGISGCRRAEGLALVFVGMVAAGVARVVAVLAYIGFGAAIGAVVGVVAWSLARWLES